MRIAEITLKPKKPKPPLTLPQARIAGLKQSIDRDRQRLSQERETQRRQRRAEQQRKIRSNYVAAEGRHVSAAAPHTAGSA